MVDIIEELKDKARLLHGQVKLRDGDAIKRLRALSELRSVSEEALLEHVQRKHCLAVIAMQIGFSGWSHAVAVLEGRPCEDMGTLLSPPGASAHWNIWSAHYEEAKGIREQHGGYLLAYKRHFFIVDRYYIESLGLDPDDELWERMARDWARPADVGARRLLYAALIRKHLESVS